MKKALFLICFGFISWISIDACATAPASGGGSCDGAIKKAQRPCTPGANTAAQSDALLSSGDAISQQGDKGTATNLGGLTTLGTAGNQAFVDACGSLADQCVQACAKDPSQDKKAKCAKFKSDLDQAKSQLGADKDANKDAKKSSDASGIPSMPSIPTPPTSPPTTPPPAPTAVAAPASATAVDCTATPTDPSCAKPVADAASAVPASAFAPSGGGSSSGSGSSGSVPSFDPTQPISPTNMPPSASNMPTPGGSSGMGTASNNNPNKELPPSAYADAAKNVTDILNGERGGGGGAAGGAGGFSGYGSGDAASLASYLPGGKLDPNRKMAAAAANRKPANVDIASMHENIFSMITKRIKILCKLKEIRDCD